ncbi:MAG: RNA 2',3'-cyclic phosphodiesterase [Candidatus Bathyarchaeia archaeon]
MPGTIRSFIAIDIENAETKRKIAAVQQLLTKTGAELKLVETQNIHITLRFLGDITPPMIEKIFMEMQKIQFTPFTIHIKGIGAFPDTRYPRIVWAGITEGTNQLKNIFNQLEPRLHTLGIQPDQKGFSPHLTIARVKSGKNRAQLAEIITKNANYEFGTIEANCLRLKKSELTPKGPLYATLREYCVQ